MEFSTTLQRLFAHDDWANHEVLLSIKNAGGNSPARRLLAHLIGAERLWLSRLQRDGKEVLVWPELAVAECETQLWELKSAWHDYLSTAGHSEAEVITYINSKGERWQNTVADILLHVVMHSQYHRGQIALVLRESGAEPAYTDYIQAVRTGCLDA
ncbi:MAG: DinB family protein [Terriglobales bacterium]|jgi:uncharacterized damage-inducible protein DinB